MGNPIISRQESLGVGLEATPGTKAATLAWQPHLGVTLDRKTSTLDNNSGLGRAEETNDSVLTEQWSEGSIQAKLYWDTFGYWLANMFGQSPTAALHSGETVVYDNTFTVAQSSVVPYLSVVRVNNIATRYYGLGVLSDLEIDMTQQDWVTFTATFMGKNGTTTTSTASYSTTEGDFHSKHVSVGFATYGSTSYTAAQIKSMKFKISRKMERFTPLGSIDPVSFDPDSYSFTGTIVQRYTDTVLENIAQANTAQAMQISIVNSDATIGSSTRPGLVITCPKVRLDPATTDNKLDQTLSQTFNLNAQLDSTGTGYACQAVLTSKKNGYASS